MVKERGSKAVADSVSPNTAVENSEPSCGSACDHADTAPVNEDEVKIPIREVELSNVS